MGLFQVPPPAPLQTSSETLSATSSVRRDTATIPVPPDPAPEEDQSSSTVEVGQFAVTVDCRNLNPYEIQIEKNGLIVQTIQFDDSLTGVKTCPQVQSEDVNFDGNADLMLLSGTGSGGSGYTYWLFSTTSQQFTCPQTKTGDCGLMNPVFNLATKTITSIDYMSAGSVYVQTYKVVNGNPVLTNAVSEDISALEASTTQAPFTADDAAAIAVERGFLKPPVLATSSLFRLGTASSTGTGQALYTSYLDHSASIANCGQPPDGGTWVIRDVFEMNVQSGAVAVYSICNPGFYDQ